MNFFDDSDGFDGEVPEDLEAWINRDKPDISDWCNHYILDERGFPKKVSLLEWGMWLEDIDNRRLEWTEEDEFTVSTVFLGLDHNFDTIGQPDHKPLLFETCILKCDKFPKEDQSIFRYHTMAEAKNGHYAIVEALRKGEMPEYLGDPSIMNFLSDIFGNPEDSED